MNISLRTGSIKGKVFAALLVLVVAGVALAALEATNVTHFFHPVKNTKTFPRTPTAGGASVNSDKGEAATVNSGNTPASNPDGSQPGDSKSNTGGTDSNAVLTAPKGDFVSNHHPNLSGKPAPNTVSSVCTTTPGATCTISFTKDNITKSLPVQTTDRGGTAYWNGWTLQSLGLTAGSWQIKATASLNGQTLSSTDAMNMEVAQ